VSLLTKTLVVLVTFLSILLVALVVPYVAQTEDLKSKLADAESAKNSAQNAAQFARDEANIALESQSEAQAELERQNIDLRSRFNTAQAARVEAEAKLNEVNARLAKLDATLASLTSTYEKSTEVLEDTLTKLAESQEVAADFQTKAIQLIDTVNERDAQLGAAETAVRRTREQMSSLESRNEKLEEVLSQAISEGFDPDDAAAAEGEIVPDPAITGQVLATLLTSDTTLIEINVGSEDNVKPKMQFLVHRDGTYIGTLVIDRVDRSASVGRLILLSKEGDLTVGEGDSVFAGRI